MAFFNANAKIIGGNIDDTIIGATTPVAGTFTTLTANTTLTAGGSGSGNVNKFYVDGTGANDATKIVQVNDGSHDCFWIDGSYQRAVNVAFDRRLGHKICQSG